MKKKIATPSLARYDRRHAVAVLSPMGDDADVEDEEDGDLMAEDIWRKSAVKQTTERSWSTKKRYALGAGPVKTCRTPVGKNFKCSKLHKHLRKKVSCSEHVWPPVEVQVCVEGGVRD